MSGVLSHHSPTLFASGYEIFSESGWWKLTHNMKPRQYYDLGESSTNFLTIFVSFNLFVVVVRFTVKTSRKERPLNDEQQNASTVPGPSNSMLGKRRRQSLGNDDNDTAEVDSCRRTM